MADQTIRIHLTSFRTLLPALGGLLLGLFCCSTLTAAPQEAPAGSTTQTPEATTQPAAAATASAPQAAPAAQEIPQAPVLPLSRKPYSVRVEIGISASAPVSEHIRSLILRDVSNAIDRMYGHMWDETVVFSDWFAPGSISRLERLTEDEMKSRFPTSDPEKVMLISFTESGNLWNVGCREFDCRVQELTPLYSSSTMDYRSLGSIAAGLMRDSFRPVLMLSQALPATEELELFLQAGDLPPRDPSAAQIAEGDVLRPFLRHLDRRDPKLLKSLQKLDLTYIRVTRFDTQYLSEGVSSSDQDVTDNGAQAEASANYIDRSRVTGVLISHGMAPFGGRGRNVQQIALRQRPMAKESRVRLVLSNRTDRPLVCHRVDRVSKLRYKDEGVGEPVRHVSDRNGEIVVPTDPANPTFWLYVYSGGMLLARVPYAPGILPTDTVKLPDDSLRLGVEGELYLFRDELVDVVARRAVFKGMAKKAAETGDEAKLETSLKAIESLKGKKEFDTDLNTVRVPAVDKAKALRNRSAQRNIEKLCNAMGSSLEEFFKTEKQLKEMEDIEKLRALAEERKQNPPAAAPQQ
ncbi:MAG: hypothetical protein JNL58_15890 [Planctomyces sp.]|nr:hypothetical protein [Planctomyces sp.]